MFSNVSSSQQLVPWSNTLLKQRQRCLGEFDAEFDKPTRSVIYEREIYFSQNFWFFLNMAAALLIIIILDYFSYAQYWQSNDDWKVMNVEETWRQELFEQNIQYLYPVKLYVNIITKSSGMEKIPFMSQYFAVLCHSFPLTTIRISKKLHLKTFSDLNAGAEKYSGRNKLFKMTGSGVSSSKRQQIINQL